MPRNSNGIYSLPPGNPVASGTTITAEWANNTIGDMAAAITDSLSRSGQGGMQAPFRNTDGSAANPGVAFNNNPTSGLFNVAGQVGCAVAGTEIWRTTPTGITLASGKSMSGGDLLTQAQADLRYVKISDIYAVGDVILSMSSVNPSARFGGSWAQIAQGRMLIGVGSLSNYSFSPGQAAGSYDKILQEYEMPYHTHEGTTGDDYPDHGHNYGDIYPDGVGNFGLGSGATQTDHTRGTGGANSRHVHNFQTNGKGSNVPFSMLNPCLAVYIWQKIG